MSRFDPDPAAPGATRSLLPIRARWLVAGLACLALVTASRVYLSLALKDVADPFPQILLGESLKWGLWLPTVPAVVALDRRLGFARSDGRGIPAALAAHLLLALFVLAGHTAIMTAAGQAGDWYFVRETARATALIRLVHEGGSILLVYGAVVALDHLQRHRREREESRLAESRLEAQLARERLRNLQAQLHPHFLFNALHAVAGLLREGERVSAVELLEQLGDLLRTALRRADRQFVSFAEELEFLETYLDIHEARHGDRLEVSWSIDPDIEHVPVPHLVLQPLVENAVRHGVEGTLAVDDGARVGRIEIVARRDQGSLVLEVLDNGPGPGASDRESEGVGLANTRARLRTLYGEDFTLEVRPRSGRG
ncbi:MAG: histidine kinase, partial [Gemmatimonadota bacterium]|nr:histidine kinase [Gemmatimonadota bacterium]